MCIKQDQNHQGMEQNTQRSVVMHRISIYQVYSGRLQWHSATIFSDSTYVHIYLLKFDSLLSFASNNIRRVCHRK